MSGGGSNVINKVFYATSYHPIQAGSIDGTDVVPHDNAVRRALLCYNAGLYDPFGDPKAAGDPYCTLFVGRLSHLTSEDTLREAMSKYGRIKSLRLVRHIVTGASRGYAFVEYENEREMRRAYEEAHHTFIDDREIIVDFNRQQLMPGWIPRRLGGGLGGRKESGQLRFGGRERPFRAPLRPIPHEDLKRLGIPPPPEGRYLSRNQVPSPPRKKRSAHDREEGYDGEERYVEREEFGGRKKGVERGESYQRKSSHSKSSHRKHSDTRIHSDRKERSKGSGSRYSGSKRSYDADEHSRRHRRRSSSQDPHSSD